MHDQWHPPFSGEYRHCREAKDLLLSTVWGCWRILRSRRSIRAARLRCLAALRNTRGIDILVSNGDATRSVGIQVKATQGGYNSRLGNPAYYIVPKAVVAKYSEARHKEFLTGKELNGQNRNDTNMPKFADSKGKYLNQWDRLGLDTANPGSPLRVEGPGCR